MARCAACGKMIVFGGVKDAGLVFCNARCHRQGFLNIVANEISTDDVLNHAMRLREGPCPKCRRHSPVGLETAHFIWSAVYLTSWHSRQYLCCRSCGNRKRLLAILSCGVLGWWGLPWGILGTPIQVLRNMFGFVKSRPDGEPSLEMLQLVRMDLAQRIIDEQMKSRDEGPSDGRDSLRG